ncbi:MAG: VWA domain-containing protein [Deltaproteobacteria bacterium]|nr:VWA domain-containing protein [Deltaproteobacteria bacterium]
MHTVRTLIALAIAGSPACQKPPPDAGPAAAASEKPPPAAPRAAAAAPAMRTAPAAAPVAVDRDEAQAADPNWTPAQAYKGGDQPAVEDRANAEKDGRAPAAPRPETRTPTGGAGRSGAAAASDKAVPREASEPAKKAAAEAAPKDDAGAGPVDNAAQAEETRDGREALTRAQRRSIVRALGSGTAVFGELGSGYGGLALSRRSSDRVFRVLPPLPAHYPRDARYRSTYLPGRGYLDHLAAVVRDGTGLGVEAALVARTPARTLAAPDGGQSLRVAVDLSDKQLPEAGGQTVLRVRLRAADAGPRDRGPLRLHLVLDSSGSMKGRPWQQVCAAVRDLSTRLGPADSLSVAHFGSVAEVLAASTPGGPQLARIADQVCALKVRGETNTFAGLQLGYQLARAAYDANASNRVLLLSDGMPTIGPNDPYGLTLETARALGQGIVTSAIGVGNDFDALLMDRVALEGGGNHHFVRDAAALPAVLTDELQVLATQAAEAVDLRIRLPDDVGLVEVVGSEPLSDAEALRTRTVEVATDQRLDTEKGIAANRQRDRDGGVRFLLPSFRAGDEHSFLLVLQVPPGQQPRQVARVEVRYKDTIARRNGQFVGGRAVSYTAGKAPVAAGEPAVQMALARARAGYVLQRASEYLDTYNLPRIRTELYAAARELQRAADATGQVAGHAEATRVQALADAAGMAMQQGRHAWLIGAFHYGWRMCGDTAWGG